MGELVVRRQQTNEGVNKPTFNLAKNISEWVFTKLRIQSVMQILANREMRQQIREKEKAARNKQQTSVQRIEEVEIDLLERIR